MFLRRYITAVIFLMVGLLSGLTGFAQIHDPVQWVGQIRETAAANTYELVFTARIQPPWHMYDLGPYDDINATEFEFDEREGIEYISPLTENTSPKRIYDRMFSMEIGYYADRAEFSRLVRVTSPEDIRLGVEVKYQVCDDQSCLAPNYHVFTFPLKGTGIPLVAAEPAPVREPADTVSDEELTEIPERLPERISASPDGAKGAIESVLVTDATSGNPNLWKIILEAILWGFAALLTPCVFPMVPMTVSFFLKGSENKRRGRFMAMLYGISIVVLYTLPIAVIILVTYWAGGDAVTANIFNWLATHWLPNVIFFIVFMVFAASFFGAFEFRLPGKWVNKTDSKADKGGLIGVFFMAVTLVLVSFSCTGPIVGMVLIKSTQGEIWEPILTMFAFSVAFALPFTLFAFFPSFLNNLPKSGGWLNSVKVVLGFVELALGLKFLSVADQTYHWGLLDREIYLALWIVIFTLMGFYLLGKIRFAHDSDVKYISVPRLGLVILTFTFVIYLLPGMWGAPLKGISGYLPPLHTQDFVFRESPESGQGLRRNDLDFQPKHSDFLQLEHGLTGFFDYPEALEYARKVNKPLFVDFTGHGCVNCREMEAKVWADSRVLAMLKNDYVIVALYSDDKTTLAESDWVTTGNGRILKTLGRINSEFAATRFGVNAQPYYVLLDGNENMLAQPRGYNLDVSDFVRFLEEGLKNYKPYH